MVAVVGRWQRVRKCHEWAFPAPRVTILCWLGYERDQCGGIFLLASFFLQVSREILVLFRIQPYLDYGKHTLSPIQTALVGQGGNLATSQSDAAPQPAEQKVQISRKVNRSITYP